MKYYSIGHSFHNRFRSRNLVLKEIFFLILIQILSSSAIFLPLLIAIKYMGEKATEEIAYLSFATNLAIGFTKSVLVTSVSLKTRLDEHNTNTRKSTDLKIGSILVLLQFFFSAIFLNSSLTLITTLHLGLLGMLFTEYYCQLLTLQRFWFKAILHYMGIISLFLSMLLLSQLFKHDTINSSTIIYTWSASTFICGFKVALEITLKFEESLKIGESLKDIKTYLASDFLLNYGIMQILYSFGTLFTSSHEMMKYRVVLFLSIPTNVVMQILNTTGIRFLLEDSRNRKYKLLFYYIFSILPLLFLIYIYTIFDTEIIGKFGLIWNTIPSLIVPFLIMSISSVALSHSSIVVKWDNLTKNVFVKRIILSLLQLPITIYWMHADGAYGIIKSLIVFNLLFMIVNVTELKKQAKL